jgi:hypothetical protein
MSSYAVDSGIYTSSLIFVFRRLSNRVRMLAADSGDAAALRPPKFKFFFTGNHQPSVGNDFCLGMKVRQIPGILKIQIPGRTYCHVTESSRSGSQPLSTATFPV